MFDDNEPIKVGELRNGLLIDDQGRRIYCPTFGPARLVPSREDEDDYRRLVFRTTCIAMAGAAIGTTALIILWEESYTTLGAWMALALLARVVSVSVFVRRWPTIPASEFSYAHYVVSTHERRNLFSLCVMILLSAIACVGFAIGPTWALVHSPINWSDLTPLKAIVFGGPVLLLTLLAPYLALSTYRAASVLRKRMQATD